MNSKVIRPSREGRTSTPRTPVPSLLAELAQTYDRLAPQYDGDRFGDDPGRYDFTETRALIQRLVRDLSPEPLADWKSLDVACGTGKTAIAVAQTGRRVVGLDASSEMLRLCSGNSKASGVQEKLTLTNASADRLPFGDHSFDLVVSFRFLHLIPVQIYPILLKEMVRVLKPGGYLIVEVKNLWYGRAVGTLKGFPDRIRGVKSENNLRNRMTIKKLELLSGQVGGLTLERVAGSLLPMGWRLMARPSLARILRQLSNGTLKNMAEHFVAVYRKACD